jgi:hypothetical protein
VSLAIDWNALGLDPASATILIPEVSGFQEAGTLRVGAPLRVEPGRGRLLVLEGAAGR